MNVNPNEAGDPGVGSPLVREASGDPGIGSPLIREAKW